jgi:hypothetical protein
VVQHLSNTLGFIPKNEKAGKKAKAKNNEFTQTKNT